MSCYIIAENGAENTRSPKVWNYTFKKLGWANSMRPVNIDKDSFPKKILAMVKDKHFEAMLITNPYKHIILNIDLPLEVEDVSKDIGAVNLIYKKNNRLLAINTDCIGASHSFIKNFSALQTKDIWLLGMGGAGKAVFYALKKRGIELAAASRSHPGVYSDISKIVKGTKNTILINATGEAFIQLLAEYQNLKTFVDQDLEIFDLRYKDNEEDEGYLSKCGVRYVDGLEMNLVQAAAAFANVFAKGDVALTHKIYEIINNYEC